VGLALLRSGQTGCEAAGVQVRLADLTCCAAWRTFLERAGYTPLPKTSETIDFITPAALSIELAQADFRVHLAAWAAPASGGRPPRARALTCPRWSRRSRETHEHNYVARADVDDRLVRQPERRDVLSELGALLATRHCRS
jgi:hypothetical protein